MSKQNLTENNFIADGLDATDMRMRMETKLLLTSPGMTYYGTGTKTSGTEYVKTNGLVPIGNEGNYEQQLIYYNEILQYIGDERIGYYLQWMNNTPCIHIKYENNIFYINEGTTAISISDLGLNTGHPDITDSQIILYIENIPTTITGSTISIVHKSSSSSSSTAACLKWGNVPSSKTATIASSSNCYFVGHIRDASTPVISIEENITDNISLMLAS